MKRSYILKEGELPTNIKSIEIPIISDEEAEKLFGSRLLRQIHIVHEEGGTTLIMHPTITFFPIGEQMLNDTRITYRAENKLISEIVDEICTIIGCDSLVIKQEMISNAERKFA